MRWLIALLLIVPVVAGHGEDEHKCSAEVLSSGLSHLQLWSETVAPGEAVETSMRFDACPLQEGWWVALWMEGDANLTLDLQNEGANLGTWPMDEKYRHVQLQATGFPVITVQNTGAEAAEFKLYFDQTCECPGKAAVVPDGALWFNLDSRGAAQNWDFRIVPVWSELGVEPEFPHDIAIRINHVIPTVNGLQIMDFKKLQFTPYQGGSCGEGDRFVGCFEFAVKGDGMQYLWMEIEHNGDPRWHIQVRPVVEVDEDAAGAGLPLLLVALALAAWRRR